MAPVSLEGRSRGQLILVGGLSLAVILVVLALILNTAIFTENLASRNDDAIAGQAIGFQQSVDREVRTAMARVNAKPNATASSYADQEAFVDDTVTALGGASGQYAARDGAAATVELTGTGITEGRRIYQDTSSTFESPDNGADWDLAQATGARQFKIEIQHGPPLTDFDSDPLSAAFKMTFDGSVTREVYIYRDSGASADVILRVRDGATTLGTCSDDSGTTTQIDFTDATVGGSPCPELEFFDQFTGSYDVEFDRADRVDGTYSLILETTGVDDTDDYDSNGNTPTREDVVYATTVQVSYRTAGVTYETTVRVAPGEQDG